MSVVPFPLPEPLAIISIGANWQIALYQHGDCAPLGVMEFATADQVVPRAIDLHIESWRLVFGEGTGWIRSRLREALHG